MYSLPAWLLIWSKLRRLEALACGSELSWHIFDLKVPTLWLFPPHPCQLILPSPSIGFQGWERINFMEPPTLSIHHLLLLWALSTNISPIITFTMTRLPAEHFHALSSHLIFTTAIWSVYNDCPHYLDGKTEAQRSEVNCPRTVQVVFEHRFLRDCQWRN